MLGDTNRWIGNTKITKIVDPNEESTANNNEGKLANFYKLSNIRMMKSSFKHKDIHKFIRSAHGRE
jgi:hypothetical protein